MLTAKTLIRLGWCPGWSESSLDAYAILLVLSHAGSYVKGRKKHMARMGLEHRTSRILCEHSSQLSYRATQSTSNNFPLPTLATKCHRGGKSTWPNRDSNPGPLTQSSRGIQQRRDKEQIIKKKKKKLKKNNQSSKKKAATEELPWNGQ